MVALGCKQTLLFPVQVLFSIPSCIPLSFTRAHDLHMYIIIYSFQIFFTLTNTTQARPATTSFSKRQREGPPHHQISRVPPLPLFDGGGSSPSLELHSSPVHLATRSLSARTLHTTAAATGGGSGGLRSSSTVSLPSSLKRSSLGAQQANGADKSAQRRQSERGHSAAKKKVRKGSYVCWN